MSFSLPKLPYPHDGLAPYMSRETLEYHHDKHHLNNCNNLAKGTEWENKPVEEVVRGTFGKQFMKLFPILFAIMISTTLGAAFAQETSTSGANGETAPAPEIEACRASGLIALKER